MTSITSFTRERILGFRAASARGIRTSALSLRRRYVMTIGAAAIAVLVVCAIVGYVALSLSMTQQQNAVLTDAARRSALLVDRVLAERLRQVDLIAWESSVIEAAKKGTATSRRRGLPFSTTSALEERFKATRSQQVDSTALEFLLDLLPKLDIAEVMLTDQYGYNAVATSPPTDFVQRPAKRSSSCRAPFATTAFASAS